MVTAGSSRALILCTLVLLDPVVEARRGGGIGGIGRHNGHHIGHHNVHPAPGGFHPSGNVNTGHHTEHHTEHHNGHHIEHHNVHPAPGGPSGGGGFHPSGAGPFHSGNDVGSVKQTSNLKTALVAGAAGAVGGVMAYEAGKAIIRSATEPFHHGSRRYYFNHYRRVPHDRFMCHISINDLAKLDPSFGSISTTTAASTSSSSGLNVSTTTVSPNSTTTVLPNSTTTVSLNSTTTVSPNSTTTVSPNSTTTVPPTSTPTSNNFFSTLQFRDGSRPKTLTWTCHSRTEVCCGTGCCAAPHSLPSSSSSSSSSSSHFLFSKRYSDGAIGVLLLLLPAGLQVLLVGRRYVGWW